MPSPYWIFLIPVVAFWVLPIRIIRQNPKLDANQLMLVLVMLSFAACFTSALSAHVTDLNSDVVFGYAYMVAIGIWVYALSKPRIAIMRAYIHRWLGLESKPEFIPPDDRI